MGKFYLDLEFTNENYYLSDILEIALIVEESGNAFHSYVSLHYSVPKRVQQLTSITNKTIKSLGLPFREVMGGLVDFLHHEQVQRETTIIAHGGYSHDFPIFLANCMKHDYDFDLTALAEYMYIDSMQVLQNRGYKRPVLDALCNDLNMKGNGHSKLEDVKILMTICKSKSEIFNQQYGFTFENILHHLDHKLLLPIQIVYNLAVGCSLH